MGARGPKTDPIVLETIAELRERGLSCRLIAAALAERGRPVSAKTVEWHCLRLGAEPPKPRRLQRGVVGPRVVVRGQHLVHRFTDDEDALLIAMDLEGATPSQMAKRLGRKANSVIGRLATLARREERAAA